MDEFRATQAGMPRPGMSGWWTTVLADLDEDRKASLMDAAADRTISHRTIATVLVRWGFTVTTAQVGHWRRNYVG